MAKRKKAEVTATESLYKAVVSGMQEKKAQHIVVMDMRHIKNAVVDYFIICSGTSDKHVEAIAESIEKEVSVAIAENPWHIEGKTSKEWMLIDYVNVVAHIFIHQKRSFFGIEELWGDALMTSFESTQ